MAKPMWFDNEAPDVPLQVMHTTAGYYIGKPDPTGESPALLRASDCYWRKEGDADAALVSGKWPRRARP